MFSGWVLWVRHSRVPVACLTPGFIVCPNARMASVCSSHLWARQAASPEERISPVHERPHRSVLSCLRFQCAINLIPCRVWREVTGHLLALAAGPRPRLCKRSTPCPPAFLQGFTVSDDRCQAHHQLPLRSPVLGFLPPPSQGSFHPHPGQLSRGLLPPHGK